MQLTTHTFAHSLSAEIVSWSLAQQVQHELSKQKFLSFTIHDIILEYLKTTIDKKDQESYHGTVVDRLDTLHLLYSNHCYQDIQVIKSMHV